MSPLAPLRSRRLWLGAALSLALFSGPLMPHTASAAIGYCRSDPMARLSDGTVVHMSASIHDAESDVQQVTYVLHAPTGTSLLDVAYTGGALADRESLLFVADEASDTYDTATVVSTGASSVDVTAETRVSGVGSAATSGQSNQTLLVHLAG